MALFNEYLHPIFGNKRPGVYAYLYNVPEKHKAFIHNHFPGMETEQIVRDLYELCEMKSDIPVYIVKNPQEALEKYAYKHRLDYNEKLDHSPDLSSEDIDRFYRFLFGFGKYRLGSNLKISRQFDQLDFGVFYEEIAIVLSLPDIIKMNKHGDFHCEDGPALVWQNCEYYFFRGINVTEYSQYILNNDLIDFELILKTANLEIQGILLDLMKIHKFLEECGAELIHSEESHGHSVDLYRIELSSHQDRNDPLLLEGVLVTDLTAKQDGTFEKYFLRVEPGKHSTAVQALESTFLQADE